jgi:predicted  nucleic acid-binding Zn-ribbon protein
MYIFVVCFIRVIYTVNLLEMSDLNSAVRNEQISDTNGISDNTDPLAPLAEEPAKSDSADTAETELSAADHIDYVHSFDKHEAEELMTPMKSGDLPDHEAEEFHEFFGEVEDHHEVVPPVIQTADVAVAPPREAESLNLSAMGKLELIAHLGELLANHPIETIINDVENIKINYYKKHKAEIEKARKTFVEQGGELEDFKASDDPYENEIKELLRKYRDLKADYNKNQDEHKHKNLEEKYKIIEEIKELVKNKESINRTFQEFREIQKRWRSLGPVPQQNVKDLWETYHHHVEAFYDYIRINQELRDLDLKKNLESKIHLCERAEELLLETNVIEAFRVLQDLHEQWREIGPVPAEMRVEIWNRFKEATSKINKKHQVHFIDLKTEQKKNLDTKTVLCEKAEELCNMEMSSNKDWSSRSHELMELQKVWKTIGFAPKKDNAKIYKRFRDACDAFFNRKREFYGVFKEEQNNNLQLKIDLCIQAEALRESNEWKKTTEELIALQQRWKEIGPVHHKQSEKVWRRFRSACDAFFERKAKHFSEIDNSFGSNLQKKNDLIKQIEEFQITDNAEEGLKKLKGFQRQWAEIGFVPLKDKDGIQEKYREVINKKFDDLHIDDNHRLLLKFKTKLEDYLEKPNGMQRVRQEREKYITRLKQLENDIVLWENNIGFFARSSNAMTVIKDVESKIENTKKDIELLNRKISIIDDMDD